MRPIVLACLLCCPLTAVDPPSGPPAGSGTWQQTFNDDFTGTTLDGTKWGKGYGWGTTTGWTQEYTDPDNVAVRDGKLIITLENIAQNGKQYTSGAVNTKGRFFQQYGYFEARLKMARGKGFLNAWWGKSNDESWPPEIDIVEVIGTDLGRAHMTVHYDESGHRQSGGSWVGPDTSADFHTYGVLWEADKIVWYIDGVERRRITDPNILGRIAKPFYWMLNVHIGNSWSGYPDATTPWPATYEADWVRAWRRAPTTNQAPAVTVAARATPAPLVLP